MEKIITRACGHKEKIWLVDGEENDPVALANHSEYLCLQCYLGSTPCKRHRMLYRDYIIEYSHCRTLPNSYDPKTKTIVVFIPLSTE